ncbi:MAG: sulfate reduction electron transfer complex DsrMKJOP subunit DsrM [candidate division Zixibacteria bacterium]|nr:sulfate reduction electron transfer complex DsrMKJOP subunit DsrM [candidate division Zixibacteria bacterium]
MNVFLSLAAVIILILLAMAGVGAIGLDYLFGVVIPYAAFLIFIVGFVYRIIIWSKSPVPFRIPTTCGQQKTLSWIKSSKLESPHTTLGVIGRMALEILFFRSLFRNTKTEIKPGPQIVYGSNKWLWLGGLAFHWSFLIILIRHLRFFIEPVPYYITMIEHLDGFFQVGLPEILLTDIAILSALTFLILRRFGPRLRYISLPADYFPLLLIISIATTGVLMRYFTKTDIVGIKELALGLATFSPVVPEGIGLTFFVHLFLVSVLLIYFPFSKLMHLGGVFLSPTRNLANNNRMKRHVNPWDYPVNVHTYEEYEDEFRDVMKAAGLPLEKES